MTDSKYDIDQIRADIEEMSKLSTETINENSHGLSDMETQKILDVIHLEDRSVFDVVQLSIPELTNIVNATVKAIDRGGRLIYVGAGTSGRLATLDAAECPPTYGVSTELVSTVIAGGFPALTIAQEGAEDDRNQAILDLREKKISSNDVVVGITARGKTPYVRSFLSESKKLGAWTALIACNRIEKSDELNELVILEVGPEVITGSTRMKAGLATKMVLTMLSTTIMVKLGKVEGNKMVDLMPNSSKLKARQAKMIMDRFGMELEDALKRLEEYHGDLRQALVDENTNIS
jgi:N-acetylmuramic acid 6-phosphate etherase